MEGTIRPWYRSRLFWLGVPGMVFLMWGWLANLDADSTLLAIVADDFIGLAWGSGQFGVVTSGDWPSLDLARTEWDFKRMGNSWKGPVPIFAKPTEVYRNQFRDDVRVDIACWCVVLVYLAAWIGILVWWQRCKSRRSRTRADLDKGDWGPRHSCRQPSPASERKSSS